MKTPSQDERFQQRYAEWRHYIENAPACDFASDDSPFVENPPFRAIVDLGPPVIPQIIAQLFQEPEAHFLHHALAELTGHIFTAEDYVAAEQIFGQPLGNEAICTLWLGWWKKGQKAIERNADR